MLRYVPVILLLLLNCPAAVSQGLVLKTPKTEFKTTEYIHVNVFTTEEYVIPTDGACNPAVLFSYQRLENSQWVETFAYKPKNIMDCGAPALKCNGKCTYVLKQRIETPGIYRVNIDDINGTPFYSKGFEVKADTN